MKKLHSPTLLFAVILITASSCSHDLDVSLKTELSPESFPTEQKHFLQLSGTVYSKFREKFAGPYWFMQSLSTDEAILPARGGNWLDGGRYQQLHLHTWNKDHSNVKDVWAWLNSTISLANQVLYYFEPAPESEFKQSSIAQMRIMRAICTFLMMDLWGNVPIVKEFGSTDPVLTVERADVFKYIEEEVKASLPYLPEDAGSNYGMPNKYCGFALLAKMYINAEVYTGSPRWQDAVAMCDSIIKSNRFSLESNYTKMFFPDNGPQVKEFIFTIPYDNSLTTGDYTMYWARYNLHRAMRDKYSLPYTPSGSINTLPRFYAYYNDPTDLRNDIWLKGKQYDHAGNPILITTTKKGYDEDYSGADAGDTYVWQLELSPDIIMKNLPAFDLGNDEKSWAEGYRCNKFYPDSTSLTRSQDNDVPLFRYADILLIKVEAIVRGASPTDGQTALSLINELRTTRKAAPFSSLTLEDVYEEFCREMAGETWHRNNMIRFGKFEEHWGFKTDSDPDKRLFPIPTAALEINPNLTQNPGY